VPLISLLPQLSESTTFGGTSWWYPRDLLRPKEVHCLEHSQLAYVLQLLALAYNSGSSLPDVAVLVVLSIISTGRHGLFLLHIIHQATGL
jgi:hypothetical protein